MFPSEIAMETFIQEYEAVLADALKAVDQEALEEYKTFANVTESDFRVTVTKYLGDYTLRVYISKRDFAYPLDPAADKLSELTRILNDIIQRELKRYNELKVAEEARAKELNDLFQLSISKVDPDLAAAYEEATGTAVAEGVYLKEKNKNSIGLYFKHWGFYFTISEDTLKNETKMLNFLKQGLEGAIEQTRLRKSTKKFRNEIDIFNTSSQVSGSAILLGESGTLYEVWENGQKELRATVLDSNALVDITEPYEVIYTRTYRGNGNHSTYRDTTHSVYYSWNSKHEDKLGKSVPKTFGREDGMMGSYTETTKLDAPNSTYHSTADGIDSWAKFYRRDVATD
jgi:hypothetical protein